MMDYLETKTFKIKPIAPVHIGSGEALKAFEYLYDRDKGIVYFLDKPAWIAMLSKYKLMDKFIALVSGRNLTTVNLIQWLRNNGVPNGDIINTAKRCAEAPLSVMKFDKSTLNDINTGIALVNGQLYIPGSSIKGVMRTGIIYHLLKQKSYLLDGYRNSISDACSGKYVDKRELNSISARIESSLIAKLELNLKKFDPMLQSSLRGLIVGDAMPVEQHDSIIVQKLDASTKVNRFGQDEHALPICRECLAPGSEYEFKITIDKRMLKTLGISSIEEILGYAREYMLDGLKLQKKVFGRDYPQEFKEAENGDFFIGAGIGFLQHTVWMPIFAGDREGFELLKKFMDSNFRMHRHMQNDREISPRTLKLAKENGHTHLMGLCRIQEVK